MGRAGADRRPRERARASARPARRSALVVRATQRRVTRCSRATSEKIQVLNLINDGEYRVRMNMPRNPFTRGQFVAGSLVPWDGEWCWSGQQRTFENLDAAAIEQFKQTIAGKPTIYYRYAPMT